jgi:hypothetical protein
MRVYRRELAFLIKFKRIESKRFIMRLLGDLWQTKSFRSKTMISSGDIIQPTIIFKSVRFFIGNESIYLLVENNQRIRSLLFSLIQNWLFVTRGLPA